MQQGDDDDDNLVNQMAGKIKTSIFSMFHCVLTNVSFPLWQAMSMMTIEFIQSLYFVFYPPVKKDNLHVYRLISIGIYLV